MSLSHSDPNEHAPAVEIERHCAAVCRAYGLDRAPTEREHCAYPRCSTAWARSQRASGTRSSPEASYDVRPIRERGDVAMADGQAVAAAAEDRAPTRAPRRPAAAELCGGRTGNALFEFSTATRPPSPGEPHGDAYTPGGAPGEPRAPDSATRSPRPCRPAHGSLPLGVEPYTVTRGHAVRRRRTASVPRPTEGRCR
jgi:hypothetical protein